MDSLTDSHQISPLDIVDTGRRRRWSDEEKRRIVEESPLGPRLASVTVRRHGISNQLLFFWRKAYREGRLGDVAGLVPAVVVPEPPETASGAAGGRIEIIIAIGRRVIVDGDVDPTQSQRRPRAKTLCLNNCYSESSASLQNIVAQIKKHSEQHFGSDSCPR
jgi:transposase